MRVRWILILFALLGSARGKDGATSIEKALVAADRALGSAKHDDAWFHIQRALERDAQSLRAWDMRARWGEAKGNRGEFVYSLHKLLRLSIARFKSETMPSAPESEPTRLSSTVSRPNNDASNGR